MDFGKISFIGSLSEIPLGELFFSLKAQRETGLLYLRRDKVGKKLYFEEGNLVALETSLAKEGFLRHLVAKKLVDYDKAIDLLRKSIAKNVLLDETIKSQNVTSESTLSDLYAQIARKSLIELFSWTGGQYAFFFDIKTGTNRANIPVSDTLETNVYKGIKKGYTKTRLKQTIVDELDQSWSLKAEPEQLKTKLGLSKQEYRLIKSLNGNSTNEKLIFGSRLELRKSLALLATLRTLRLITENGRERPTDVLSDFKLGTDSGLSLEELTYAQRLMQSGNALLEQTPFELLEVGRQFTDTDLRKGYYKLAQRYHQREIIDKLPAPLKELSNKIFDRISESFEALLTVEKAKSEKTLDLYFEMDDQLFANLKSKYSAMIRYFEGRSLFDDKHYHLAVTPFAEAAETDNYEGEYRAYKAICRLRNNQEEEGPRIEAAISELKRALGLNSTLVLAELALAEAAEKLGKKELAHEYFGNALNLKPNNEDARRGYHRTKEPFALDSKSEHSQDAGKIKQIEDKLNEFMQGIEKKNHFKVLRVKEGAGSGEIRKAYFQLAKEYHPDRMGPLKNHPLAEEVFLKINQAYDVLSSERKRRLYERSLRSKKIEKEFKKSQQTLESKKMFAKAKNLLNDRKFDKAFSLFKQIDQIREGCPECHAYMGYSLFLRDSKTNPNIIAEAEGYFEKALEMDSLYTEANVLWGKMYNQMGQYRKALRHFQQVLEIDPDNTDALREIRLINQRKSQTQDSPGTSPAQSNNDLDKKGLFGSIFNKKK